MRNRNTRRLPAWLATGAIAGASLLPASPGAAEEMSVGSAVSTALYAPAKAVYATVGILFGGIAWGLSGGNGEVAKAVIEPAVTGDYVVTPSHLRGERRLAFVGDPETESLDEEAGTEDDPYAEYSWGDESTDY